MKILPKKSKQGITLVESVIAVVVLGIFATGIMTLLTAGGVKIKKISNESSAYAEAVQMMDMAISAISNGSSNYLVEVEEAGTTVLRMDGDALKTAIETSLGTTLEIDLTKVDIDAEIALYDESEAATPSNVRGWYLTLTYHGAEVTGFASNTQGVFDTQ